MTSQTTCPRFVVEKHGPGAFCVFDTATGVSRHPCFTRRGAQKIANRKNAASESPSEGTR